MKIPLEYPLYETTYGNEIPFEQVYLHHYNVLPSKYYDMKVTYDTSIIDKLEENGFVEKVRLEFNNRRHDTTTQSFYINTEKEIMIKTSLPFNDMKANDGKSISLEIFYNIEKGKLDEQLNLEEYKSYIRNKKKANIHLVKSDMGHLDTEEYEMKVPPMDLELNYGSDFHKIHDVIINRLNKPNDKGIILLHGDPGTGKTSYIKYLTSLVKDKDILFIPPSMAEMLSEPTIIPFLMEHKNSILIIEDSERVIGDREGNGSPAGVSNILNLTDGILGDCLNIQIVATFNMRREKIDKALLRKGRLIAEHKFEKLSIEDTNKLLESLGKDTNVTESMCLADIYNIDVELIKTENKTNKIGFTNG